MKTPTPTLAEADALIPRRNYTATPTIALELTGDESASLEELAGQWGLAVTDTARALLAMGLARAGREVRA